YRQTLLDSIPGSTCRMDVDESANGFATFRRICICFKRVKDGGLVGCRKIGLSIQVVSKSWKVRKGDQSYDVNLQHKLGVWVKDTTVTIEDIDEAPVMETSKTNDLVEGITSVMVEDMSAPAMNKGKGKESVANEASAPKRKKGSPPSHVNGIRIYHKNRRRSERFANMKKPF
nr:calcium/proton exchanger [Tanacetum cinerariifolium]